MKKKNQNPEGERVPFRAERKKKPSKDIQKLARRIKTLRLRYGYSSYEHFAFDAFLGRTQFARYEQGSDIPFTSLLKLARAFNLSLSEFLEGI